MTRKDFIVNACTACMSATAISSLLPSCTFTRYTSGNLAKDGLTVNKDEFMIRQKGNTAYRSFIIVRNDALQYPICVYRFNEQEYSALWMKCTHQGTELQASGDFLQCPAHGSEFNNKGQVTNGPADNGLRTFPVIITNNELFIDLRKQL
ncbi:Rieske 2Fe-2S domain-containing protein [Agriterribacter sp.]|jgi:Rieske Fe-S protein|uniref:Rieske (2Fe-2S) protein n=1 Tax=Agriterribacter sp. TaxID=2821509 RepID=UPI002BB6007A|nr:Rieske 2Fe-2S domain-containing protein [Agriterribacter sp.]HRN47273.1 Rieske 2Fe-2S domain-containing protein [Niabella sp.]HRO46724.1 Rieske 2Fe-2S domain-containing protein [Agriterribacter sp.]